MKKEAISNTFNEVLERRLSRRTALKGMLGTTSLVAGATGIGVLAACKPNKENIVSPPLEFQELPHGYDTTHHVAPGYSADVLIRWGDPLLAEAPDNFSGGAIDAESQKKQFGYNNDFIGFQPLPIGSNNSDHGLLCVNHEYTTSHLMFPNVKALDTQRESTIEEVDIEMAAHGHSVIEIKKQNGRWYLVDGSKYNRRLTANTEMEITGPAAGHHRLKTSEDPTGRKVLGTLANCAGGVTPWGTILIAEENFQLYFDGDQVKADEKAPGERRGYGLFNAGYYQYRNHDPDLTEEELANQQPELKGKRAFYRWADHYDRFNIEKEPREINRFGWMVEYDPYNPESIPKKRTALGRFAHEGATIVAEHGKQVVAYSGDDGKNQFIYKFVSKSKYDKHNRSANMELLAEGDLFAAKFHPTGVGEWLKVELQESGWASPAFTKLKDQAEALIEARLIARLLGATAMDRPEDIETNPLTGRTYVMLTNNSARSPETTDPANPRADNRWGQIVEILPPGVDGDRDHLAPHFQWEMFLLAGDPNHPNGGKRGRYHKDVSKDGWFSNPDNVAFDPDGRMWISTDGFPKNLTPEGLDAPVHDGIWACETTGENRALTRHFFGCPVGAEMCGPCFTPDGESFFVSVQHPGDTPGSDYSNPSTRWPDFEPNNPPRPSVVAITKKGGGKIG
ncbi:PhoX family phosphatase [Porticoccus sp. W117]|uniref:PhoX family protein n=1 Tax=Porticoccus sp. W117 TaxID=3054777 RepID=UPI0025953209|nr:PhoX family phosphatase [Porticoccus sp. W117]MDM3872208.1 PhoX family phosphatase [Porticoccus sp. W117]